MRAPVELALALGLLVATCRGLVVSTLNELPTLSATIGKTQLAPRAIYCDHNGFFTRLQAVNPDRTYTATLEVCCSDGSNARYEGDGGVAHSRCLNLGAGSISSGYVGGTLRTEFPSSIEDLLSKGATNDGVVRTADCGADAISSIGYVDAAKPPSELSDLPWEQLCSVGQACGLGTDLAVGCKDMNSDGAVMEASVPGPKHACSDGEIVQAVYARWDGRSVQAVDGIRCRKIYARPEGYAALMDPLESCGQAPAWQDARCQGTAGDYCGCLKIDTASRDSFYGCVLSGSTTTAPLYTLPGVLQARDVSDPAKHCSVGLVEESVGTGLWQTLKVAGSESECLTMDASTMVVTNAPCTQDASELPSQLFRRISTTPNARDSSATAIGALEPAVAPGICVFNTPANGILARCSCEALALGQCVIDGVSYIAIEQFIEEVVGPYTAGYMAYDTDAQSIAGILSTLAAEGDLESQLGAPIVRAGDLPKQLAENPQTWFDWAGVVRGGPSGIVQLLVQPFGGYTGEALAPELLAIPGLLGVRVANADNMVGPLPAVSPESQLVALEVSNTRVTGTVPESWGLLPKLNSLTLYATALDGPMPATFVGTTASAFLIEGNTGDAFCGSGSAESALSAALPACSTIDGIAQASYFVNAVLKDDVPCDTLVPGIQKGLVKETAHFVQISSVACTTYAADAAAPAARRMLRTSRSLLDASAPSAPESQLVEVAYTGPESSFDQLEAATATAAAQVEDDNVIGLEASPDRPARARAPRDEEPDDETPEDNEPADPDTGDAPAGPTAGSPNDGPSNPTRNDSPAASSPPVDGDGDGDDDSNVGAIAGGIGGALVLAIIACCLFWFCCWKKRKQRDPSGSKFDYELSSKPKETPSTMRLNVDARGHTQPPPHGTPLKDSAHRTPVKTGYRTEPAPNHRPAIAGGALAAGGVLGTLAGNVPDTPLTAPGAAEPLSGTSSMTRSGSTDSDKILPKIRVSGSSRSMTRVPAVPLPSSSNNYPLSAECSRLSSREIHRRMRSASLRSAGKTSNEASGETEGDTAKAAAGDAKPAANPDASERERSAATPAAAATTASGTPVVAASDGYNEDSLGAPGPAVTPRYANPAPYTGGDALASADNPSNPQMVESPRLVGGLQRHDSFVSSIGDSGSLISRGLRLRTTTRRPSSVRSLGGPGSPDAFTQRLGESFATSVIVNSRALSARSGSSLTGGASLSRVSFTRGGGDSSRISSADNYGAGSMAMTQVFGASQTVGASAWATASVLSDGTTVYTDIGGIEMDDAIASMEALLNRCQTELEGQVGSYRLQGPRHRFAGRTSVVAFADGMWGGQFALKFYCEPDAAKREFAIYKKATELNMVLPPVQELEDNAGGVFRLKDGTPLPPHLAMPRGLPLPEWYAVHQPSQLAILECLAQSLHRLEQLHLSGYCHNDVKPANIILLESPNEREPRWHIVDFTAVAQSGDQVRARYTLEYASPELVHAVNSMRANYVTCQNSMDIWSMGVIMYEVITAEPFFPIDADRDAMRDGLVGLEPLPFEEDRRSLLRVPEEGGLRDTVLAMLSREPTMRPTAATVGRALRQCIRDLTGDSPERLDASPVSSIGGMDTSQELR